MRLFDKYADLFIEEVQARFKHKFENMIQNQMGKRVPSPVESRFTDIIDQHYGSEWIGMSAYSNPQDFLMEFGSSRSSSEEKKVSDSEVEIPEN